MQRRLKWYLGSIRVQEFKGSRSSRNKSSRVQEVQETRVQGFKRKSSSMAKAKV